MSGKLFVFVTMIFGTSTLLAEPPFCLQTKDGLNCSFFTEADCEAMKGDHEFCTINPDQQDAEGEKSVYLHVKTFTENLCSDTICFRYSQENCTEEDYKDNEPLRCSSNH